MDPWTDNPTQTATRPPHAPDSAPAATPDGPGNTAGAADHASPAADPVAPTDPAPASDESPLARIDVLAPVSIIVPTFREADNLPHLLARLDQLRTSHRLQLEVLIMDDQSRDGSAEAVAATGFDWVRFIEREGERGLSPAVIDGLRAARHPVLVVMDADLSHPPEKIPDLILALEAGQQMVIGSRYVPGGSTDDDWGIFRWLNSRVATLLARPLTAASDPMAGYFAMRRSDFLKAQSLNPVGYKIALELIVKCGVENVGEVPIHFSDRVHGESKLTLKEQLRYIQHLRRLYIFRFGTATHLAQFLAVGAIGTVVNLVVLTAAAALGVVEWVAIALGIAVSMVSNFLLNRRFTFSYARDRNIWKQFAGFVAACSVGMLVNFATATGLRETALENVPYGLQLAALAGIAAGMLFNFTVNRYFVFREKVVRKAVADARADESTPGS